MNEPINQSGRNVGMQSQLIPNSKLQQLKRLLQANLQIQRKLKKSRDIIKDRMKALEQYITTFKLRDDHPVPTSLISYLKFERNLPFHFKEQLRIVDNFNFKGMEQEENNNKFNDKERKKKIKTINFSNLSDDPKKINFRQLAKAEDYPNVIEFFRAWNESKKVKRAKEPYSLQQEEAIIQRQKIYGDCWQKICQIIETRAFQDIYYQFHNRLNPKIVAGRWNTRQSLMLIILLEHYGTKKWSLIGEKMVIKSELQVRERFCNIIDPNLGKDTYWTEQMQNTLMRIANQYEFCWKNIAKLSIFNNKTDNCIWRKFRSLMMKKNEEQILAIIPDTNNRGLAKKIIKFKDSYQSRNRRFQHPQSKQSFDPNVRAREIRETMHSSGVKSVESISEGILNNVEESKSKIMQQYQYQNQDSNPQYIHFK